MRVVRRTRVLMAAALAALAVGCKPPTQDTYSVLGVFPPAGTPSLRAVAPAEHYKEDFTWEGVPIRVKWSAASDDAGCMRVISVEVSRTGGPPERVVKMSARWHEPQRSTPCTVPPGGRVPSEVVDVQLERKNAPQHSFAIDGGGGLGPR